jgi:excisionase family DNA binding protein
MEEQRLLTIEETARFLRISKATLHRLLADKTLIPVRIGGRTLFDMKDLNTFIEESKEPKEKTGKKRGRKPKKEG